jgi:hypothetical protein
VRQLTKLNLALNGLHAIDPIALPLRPHDLPSFLIFLFIVKAIGIASHHSTRPCTLPLVPTLYLPLLGFIVNMLETWPNLVKIFHWSQVKLVVFKHANTILMIILLTFGHLFRF